MKIHACEQNSLDWLVLRSGVVTASEMDSLVPAKWKIKEGEGPKTYLAKKLAEKWLGGPLPGFMDINMELGQILEGEAIPAYEFEFSQTIQRVGFITTDDGRCGCSPDGLIGEDGGIEIKCPRADTHMKYLLSGEVPDQYLPQIHFSMYVTGRKWWKFMSYHRRMPTLVKMVEWDQEVADTLDTAAMAFLERMDEGWKKLVALNGGKEPKRAIIPPPAPVSEPDCDIIP